MKIYIVILFISTALVLNGCVSNSRYGLTVTSNKNELVVSDLEQLPKETAVSYLAKNFKYIKRHGESSRQLSRLAKQLYHSPYNSTIKQQFNRLSKKAHIENEGKTTCVFELNKMALSSDRKFTDYFFVKVMTTTYETYPAYLVKLYTPDDDCGVWLRKKDSIKKVGSALYSLGVIFN